MDLTHADRVKTVVRWLTVTLGKKQVEIAQMCGYDNGAYFSQLLNGKKPIAASLDEKLVALHPDLNIEYLRGGSDNMFLSGPGPAQPLVTSNKKEHEPIEKQPGIYVPFELMQMFSDLSAAVRSQQETIRFLAGVDNKK